MARYKEDISKCAGQIIASVIKDDYVDAEKHARAAVAHGIAGRIAKECSAIRRKEKAAR